jgi:hypothetical protein
MYEDTLFDKITLQKEIDNSKFEYNKEEIETFCCSYCDKEFLYFLFF